MFQANLQDVRRTSNIQKLFGIKRKCKRKLQTKNGSSAFYLIFLSVSIFVQSNSEC